MTPRHRVELRLFVDLLEERRLLTVNFAVDLAQNHRPISRLIYGVNEALNGAYSNLAFTRLGGNRWTAYNWENNASNAGSDYIFQNDDYLGGGNTPGGALIPTLQNASSRNAGTLVTVPIVGYVAADKNQDGDVHNSGANYLQTRFHQELAHKPTAFSLTPNTTDAYVYQDEFVNWLKTNFSYGETDANRPIYFSLDNEPDLWSSTHSEVHPNALTYAELVQKTIDYARAIKAVESGAKIFGPANYGWEGYVNLQEAPDAGGRDFQAFYLQQLKQAEMTYGKRLLDVLDVHWYPEAQGGGVRITGSDVTPAVVAARLQAPRSLWDSTYTETSWITQYSTLGPINLLPRLQTKISNNYAGTKLSISEYNYGGGNHISGGIAQADVLGIFGRDGVFSANEWRLAADESFIAGAFQMFRNFDGHNAVFGDTSVSATTSDVAGSSIYASVDSANPNVVTLVAINKTGSSLSSHFQIGHLSANSTATAYQLTGTSSNPQYAGQFAIADPNNFNYVLPAYSVTTLRIVMASSPNHAPTLNAAKSPTMAHVVVNSGAPVGAVGTPVSQLVDLASPAGQVDNVTDADANPLLGIAVTAAPQTHGIGYYSLNGGTTWSFIGVLGTSATRLLAADANTRLYFKPAAGFTGTVSDAFKFRAWDRTSGTNGGLVNSSVNGGATSLSAAEDTIAITVQQNSAPVLNINKSPVLNSVAANSGNPVGAVGTLVSKLVDLAGPLSNVSDVDSGTRLGIAITAADTSHGTWFYSTTGGSTWLALGLVGNASARLLAADAATRLFFKPNAGFKGLLPTAITFRAWDRTTGTNGSSVSTNANGGTAPFSLAVDTASLSVV